jgi:hypothetical protein
MNILVPEIAVENTPTVIVKHRHVIRATLDREPMNLAASRR